MKTLTEELKIDYIDFKNYSTMIYDSLLNPSIKDYKKIEQKGLIARWIVSFEDGMDVAFEIKADKKGCGYISLKMDNVINNEDIIYNSLNDLPEGYKIQYEDTLYTIKIKQCKLSKIKLKKATKERFVINYSFIGSIKVDGENYKNENEVIKAFQNKIQEDLNNFKEQSINEDIPITLASLELGRLKNAKRFIEYENIN